MAEKVEAIVKLGTATTRFKDFFDLYLLSDQKRFDGPRLLRQVSATFDHRGTTLADDVPVALTDEFASRSDSQRQWKAFLRRNDAEGAPEQFGDAIKRIRDFIYPVLRAAARKDGDLNRNWDPEIGWVE